MKRAAKWIAICALSGVVLLLLGKVTIQYIEREANIGLATGDLRQLGLAWRIYADENEGESPNTLQDLINSEILTSDLFEYNGNPRCRAMEFPEIVYKGSMNADEPEASAVLARQRWSESVELILYADGNVERRKP